MKRFIHHLTEDDIEFLRLIKEETGCPAAATIRRLLNDEKIRRAWKERKYGEVPEVQPGVLQEAPNPRAS